MSEDHILVDRIDNILQLTLNRPEKLNALTVAMIRRMWEAVIEFREDPALRVMLIRSQGRYFSAGVDQFDNSEPRPSQTRSGYQIRNLHRIGCGDLRGLCDEIEQTEKPFVVAHQATCVGGGLEMSLSCDFRLTSTATRYSFPEARLGCLPATGGVSRLTRLVGPQWARYMVMANKQVDAQRALMIGLVHEVYPEETFEEEVMKFCRDLAGELPEFMAVAKIAIELANDLEGAQARSVERLANSSLMAGDEFREAVVAHRSTIGSNRKR